MMRSTFAARDFADDIIADELIYKILENARFAPSGGNRQGWKVVVVRRPEIRENIKNLIEPVFRRYLAQVRAQESPWNSINATKLTEDQIRETEIPHGFLDRLVAAPVLLFVFVDLSVVASMDMDLDRVGVISGASIYPFAWNILLSARNEGLGGTITTFGAVYEQELFRQLNVPDHFAFAAMLPIGKPVKQLTKLARYKVEEFTTSETFDGPALTSDK